MNKEIFVNEITSHIKDCYAVSTTENKRILYKELKNWILAEDEFKAFLYKKKNPVNYIDNILKYDKLFMQSLLDSTQLNIKRHRKGYFTIEDITKAKSIVDASDALKTVDMSDLGKYYCPYNHTIKETRCALRNKFKIALTNEPIFCEYLQGFMCISDLVKYLHKNNDLRYEYVVDKISIYENQGNSVVCSVDLSDGYIGVSSVCSELSGLIHQLEAVYPFTHFVLTKQIVIMFLIYSCKCIDSDISTNELKGTSGITTKGIGTTESDKASLLNYLTFNQFDITKNTMVSKYFSSDFQDSDAYRLFYQGKLDSMVFAENDLITTFYSHIDKVDNDMLVSFIVGYYKLFIYVKNKFNREVKKCAMDFYHNKMNIVKVVSTDVNVNI